ncbi:MULTISPECIES: DUF2061 domain-containing protein [unclassified Leeuwenhoekiella]|uniref:DUF2061 domain-containing protein n=1 Tax=unclassified Leeuwenhoekiella TaxID=2615029 RepID=UPI000C638261|nr:MULTISPECIES: DUF2061 domain-containing protein [unclassified Leeuwenhoekiella]MBA82520.1 hypothetical protein [Leeuwenhoekiella sp.]|tara:strand:+ start:1071 stop:1343 length:273 start_codon:yes stop_codon:yes gene_type:complete
MILDQIYSQNKTEETVEVSYKKDTASEKPLRSIVKSISWRIVGTMDTVLISWFITGALTLAFSIGAVELVTKMVLYFFHERIWNTINWGK